MSYSVIDGLVYYGLVYFHVLNKCLYAIIAKLDDKSNV